MEAICQEPPPPLQDLKVTVQESSLVFPSQETERKSMFLSNIDQVLNFDVLTVHFFPANKDFPASALTQNLRNTLSEALVPYDFLAGRLEVNANTGRFEIDCNAAGAGFVVASSDFTLDEIGDLAYPNPAFEQLVCKDMDSLKADGQPICVFQVTHFKCGGFAMGFSVNHTTFDGISFRVFLDNFAALAAKKPLAVTPCNNRQLLAARSPPRVTFPHPEFLNIEMPLGHDCVPTVFDATPEPLHFKIFKLTTDDISRLKHKAKPDHPAPRVSGFNVVTSHIWRCKALSFDCENNPERSSTILFAVDLRKRLIPQLPESYAGNAVMFAYATAKCKELEEGPFSQLVEMVAQGAKRMTDEYARSAIDWPELYKGFPNGELLVSSWWKLGFTQVDYPWGRPRSICPVVDHRKDIILLLPDIIDDRSYAEINSGVNVLVSLPKKEMEKFEALFYKFLA